MLASLVAELGGPLEKLEIEVSDVELAGLGFPREPADVGVSRYDCLGPTDVDTVVAFPRGGGIRCRGLSNSRHMAWTLSRSAA